MIELNAAQKQILNAKMKEVYVSRGRSAVYFDDNTYVILNSVWNNTISKHMKNDTNTVFFVWLKNYLIKNINKFKFERLHTM